jgi:hypothetical protein
MFAGIRRANEYITSVALGALREMCTKIVLVASFWGALRYSDHKDLLSKNKFLAGDFPNTKIDFLEDI